MIGQLSFQIPNFVSLGQTSYNKLIALENMKKESLSQTQNSSTNNGIKSIKPINHQKDENINIGSSEPLAESVRKNQIQQRVKIICIVCMSQQSSGKLFNCIHKVMCLKCAERYVVDNINMEKIPTCLILQCKAPMLCTKQSIFSAFSTRTHLLWKAFELKSSIKGEGVAPKCQTPDCPGFLNPKTSICQICSQKHCSECHRHEHPGECIGISMNLLNVENIKFCKYCSMKISKQGGCPKIRCRSCGRQICYQCLTEWSLSHHGCSQFGWLSFPFHFFSDMCCNDSSVNRQDEFIVQLPSSRFK